MKYKVMPVWATIDKEGDYVDIFNTKLLAEKELAREVSSDPHCRLKGVEQGWVVVDDETGVAPDGAKDWHWDQDDASHEARMFNEDPAMHMPTMRRSGGLRPEVLQVIKDTYPVGCRVKIQSMDINNKVLRDSLVGETVTVTGISDDGSMDLMADRTLWGENKDFTIPFGKATYQKVSP